MARKFIEIKIDCTVIRIHKELKYIAQIHLVIYKDAKKYRTQKEPCGIPVTMSSNSRQNFLIECIGNDWLSSF